MINNTQTILPFKYLLKIILYPELFMITCLFTKSTALAVEATLDASPYQQIF